MKKEIKLQCNVLLKKREDEYNNNHKENEIKYQETVVTMYSRHVSPKFSNNVGRLSCVRNNFGVVRRGLLAAVMAHNDNK